MLIAILVRRKIVFQGQHKTGEQPFFQCGPTIKVRQNISFNENKNIL